ncbi:MAG: carboxypeptidase regulatory-like domain-containing protein [Gemmatimonadaceae bacterium]
MTTPSSATGVRPRRPSFLRGAGTALLLTALATPAAWAQTSTSNLRGYVRTASGAPVADAQVAARSVDNNQTRGTTSTASGYYYLGGLRPGRYEITFRRIGFAPQTETVQLLIGQTRDLNFTAAEAAAQLSTVVVTGGQPGTETRTSEVGTNITRDQIENLPNFERNFLDIAKLAPGMTASQPNNTDKFLAAGGQPAEAVNVFVDGATYKNDVLKGGVVGQDASRGNPFPQGAVQEFRVITQNYKAEYQKAGSAIITATTRSGTNTWDAELFGYGVPKGLTARDAFTVSKGSGIEPNYTRTQAGGSLGGPIVRDKLFFFGTYELNFRDEPQYVRPGTTTPPPGLDPSQYEGRFISEFREHLGFGKLTWVPTDRSTVDAGVTLRHDADFRGFGGQTAYEAAENIAVDVFTGVANWRRAGDRWLNEAQVNLQNFTWNPTPTNPGLIARNYEGLIRVGGKEAGQDWNQQRLSLRDDVTRAGVQLFGDHAFKMGGSVDFLSYEATKNFFFTTPLYTYVPGNNYATPVRARFGFGDPTIGTHNTQFGVYAQDDWNVTRRLTLNLGLRWDGETNMINNSYVTPQPLADSLRLLAGNLVIQQSLPSGSRTVSPISSLGGLENFLTTGSSDRPMYKKAFQPRVGASYDVSGDGRTVVFGGVGIYYDRNYWNTLFDEQFRRQYSQLDINFSDNCNGAFACVPWDPRYEDPAQLRTLGYATAPEVFLIANDLRPPKTHQFSAGLRQALGGYQLTLSYNGIRGYNFMNFVRASPWGGPETTPTHNYNTVFITDDNVRTYYNALQFQAQRPLLETSRWGGGLSYTLGKSQERGKSTDIFWDFNDAHPTVSDMPKVLAPGDQRHAITANAVVRLPAQFIVSSIVTLGTGIALTATDASGGWGPYQQQPYTWTPPGRPFLGMGHVFATQNMDLRVEKPFTVGVGQQASLVADLFNAFNSSNWGCYETTIIPTGDQPNDAGWRSRFGRPQCAGLGRRLQLGLRYGYRARASGT